MWYSYSYILRMDCTLVHMHWTRLDVVRFRKALGLSQADFAKKLGTNQSTLSKVETGKSEIWPMLAQLLTCMHEKHELGRSKDVKE